MVAILTGFGWNDKDDTPWVWGPTIKKQGHFVGKFLHYWLKIVNIRSHANWAAICVSGGHLFLELWYKRAGGRRDGRSWGVLRRWRKKRNWLRTLNLTHKYIIAKITHIQLIFWEKDEQDTCSITEVTAPSLPLTPCNLRKEKSMWFWNEWIFSVLNTGLKKFLGLKWVPYRFNDIIREHYGWWRSTGGNNAN